MYALVINNKIEKVFSNPEPFTLNDNQYPAQVFTLWSNEEKQAIGIYEIETDSSKFKDESYYNNTNEIFEFKNGKAIRKWGTATAKQLEDVNAVDQNNEPIIQDGKQLVTKGLKSQKISVIKQQASGLLSPTDWYVVKASEVEGYTIPTNIKTFRTAVRTKSNEMEAMITACNTVAQLKTLYEYTGETNPTRPIGEFPKLEVI
jgi:hypothetical protein